MTDHVYKPWEVPKGERWEYFLEYYKKPTIAVILILVIVGSILYSSVFAPKSDVMVLSASYVYVDYTVWDEVAQAMSEQPFDYNGDGRSLVEFNAIQFNEATHNGDPEAHYANQTRLAASIAEAESLLQIVDKDTLPYFEEQDLLATYAELSWAEEQNKDEVIKIPLKTLAPFRDVEGLPDGLYMTVRPKALMHIDGNEKKQVAYENQMHMLQTMMMQ